MRKEMIAPLAWGIVIGAIGMVIFIFATELGITQGNAKEMVDQAVVNKVASICVAQFQQDPQWKQKLTELAKIDEWQRDTYVVKQGWATAPGEEKPGTYSDLADEVARRLGKLIK